MLKDGLLYLSLCEHVQILLYNVHPARQPSGTARSTPFSYGFCGRQHLRQPVLLALRSRWERQLEIRHLCVELQAYAAAWGLPATADCCVAVLRH
jgi:hypothetical protein